MAPPNLPAAITFSQKFFEDAVSKANQSAAESGDDATKKTVNIAMEICKNQIGGLIAGGMADGVIASIPTIGIDFSSVGGGQKTSDADSHDPLTASTPFVNNVDDAITNATSALPAQDLAPNTKLRVVTDLEAVRMAARILLIAAKGTGITAGLGIALSLSPFGLLKLMVKKKD